MSFDFNQTHNYNKQAIEGLAQFTIMLWTKHGRPMDKEINKEKYPELWHWNIYLSGLIERLKLILQNKNDNK